MFIGPALSDAFNRKLEGFRLRIESPAGVLFDRDVNHPNDHPLRPIHWLANYLSQRKESLLPGGIITTGSYAGIIEVPMGVPLKFTYGDLGSFSVELEPYKVFMSH
jgi:2-keto-4-pentenoate hydratase